MAAHALALCQNPLFAFFPALSLEPRSPRIAALGVVHWHLGQIPKNSSLWVTALKPLREAIR